MSELMMDYGDRDWLQSVADNDTEDNILSIGRATRIVNSIAKLEARQKPPEKDTWEEAYGIQADQIIKLNRENSKLKAQLEGMRLAYEICKDPALKPHRKREND
jgi:hypothetical protein